MRKVVIEHGATRITVESLDQVEPASETVHLSDVFGSVGKLDLADFDKPEPTEEPRECDVVGCRREATTAIELIDDSSHTIGHYCGRHADVND